MDNRTQAVKTWLDRRYSKVVDGHYFAHAPVYGFTSEYSEPNQVLRLARTYNLLTTFAKLPFLSFLDVGGGEGYVTALVRDLFGVPAYCSDISVEAGLRAGQLFDVHSVANEAARLPFRDKSFDLVLCSEVIEHLTTPIHVISELARVAAKYLIITTSEFCPLGEIERALRVASLEIDYPHAERNWYTRNDFLTLLGDKVVLSSQMRNFGGYATQFFARKNLNQKQIEKALDLLTASTSLDSNHDGVLVVSPRPDSNLMITSHTMGTPRVDAKRIISRLLSPYVVLGDSHRVRSAFGVDLLPCLMCLACQGSLSSNGNQLLCMDCGQLYEVRDGVPIMFFDSGKPGNGHADTRAVTLLSQGDEQRARKIRALIPKLHAERPRKTSQYKKSFAEYCLKLLWLLRRPGTVKGKVHRLLRRVRKQASEELVWLEQQFKT